MLNPFNDLLKTFNKLLEGTLEPITFLERCFKDASVAQPDPHTSFERQLLQRLETAGSLPGFQAVYVSVWQKPHISYQSFLHPHTDTIGRDCVTVSALPARYSLQNLIDLERRADRQVVMILDPARSLEQQIPGWSPGTITFPDKFLSEPVIAFNDPDRPLGKSRNQNGITVIGDADYIPDNSQNNGGAIKACHEHGKAYTTPALTRGVVSKQREP